MAPGNFQLNYSTIPFSSSCSCGSKYLLEPQSLTHIPGGRQRNGSGREKGIHLIFESKHLPEASLNNGTLPFMLPIHGVITRDKGRQGLTQESHASRLLLLFLIKKQGENICIDDNLQLLLLKCGVTVFGTDKILPVKLKKKKKPVIKTSEFLCSHLKHFLFYIV